MRMYVEMDGGSAYDIARLNIRNVCDIFKVCWCEISTKQMNN